MNVDGKQYHTIWFNKDNPGINIIDQRKLPFQFEIEELKTSNDVAIAIKDMHLRGAPLIGAAAAAGLYLEAINNSEHPHLKKKIQQAAVLLLSTRPTAINLKFAIDKQLSGIELQANNKEIIEKLYTTAQQIISDEIENCRRIGENGYAIIKDIQEKKNGKQVNILTHCNAGWLACIEYGTATAPIYNAFDKGLDIHVWIDETRPRNQGARLTAWELDKHGVPHTVIADNTGGHLMQHGQVDLVIVGADRVTKTGDAANKIGTYLKALAAKDNNIPFYVAIPGSSIDWQITDGIRQIPIEERDAREVSHIEGWDGQSITQVRTTPENSAIKNYGFDVTPNRLISGIITEMGICEASEEGLSKIFNLA